MSLIICKNIINLLNLDKKNQQKLFEEIYLLIFYRYFLSKNIENKLFALKNYVMILKAIDKKYEKKREIFRFYSEINENFNFEEIDYKYFCEQIREKKILENIILNNNNNIFDYYILIFFEVLYENFFGLKDKEKFNKTKKFFIEILYQKNIFFNNQNLIRILNFEDRIFLFHLIINNKNEKNNKKNLDLIYNLTYFSLKFKEEKEIIYNKNNIKNIIFIFDENFYFGLNVFFDNINNKNDEIVEFSINSICNILNNDIINKIVVEKSMIKMLKEINKNENVYQNVKIFKNLVQFNENNEFMIKILQRLHKNYVNLFECFFEILQTKLFEFEDLNNKEEDENKNINENNNNNENKIENKN